MHPFSRRLCLSLAAAILLFISSVYVETAEAQPASNNPPGKLQIEQAWARATPPAARTGAVYLTLINHGDAPERLVSAVTSAAARAELHAHSNDGGVMRMKAVDAVTVPPGKRVSLEPAGVHVMLIDLKGPLRDGTRLSLTLSFANAGDITVEVPVLRNPPTSPSSGHRH
jgi:periplasmic copper chaperone A